MRSALSGFLVVCSLTLATQAHAAADPWVTAKVKMALWSTKGLPSTRIMVDTTDGVVTLYGKVPTHSDRMMAQQVAQKVKGVTRVNDLLQVVAKGSEGEVAKSDKDIRQEVQKRLDNDSSLSGSSISVKSVDKGVVLLSGTADSFMGNYEAMADAYFVDGVRHVSSEIKAPDGFVVEEWSFSTPGQTPSEGLKQVSKDVGVTAAVKEKLAADSDVPSTKIHVDTTRGQVMLFGTVATQAQKMAAEADAKSVSGANVVTNEIDVKGMAGRAPVVRDDIVEKEVKQMLAKDKELDDINVNVANGVVKLTGKAPSSWQRSHAALMSREAKGARSVENEIQVSKD